MSQLYTVYLYSSEKEQCLNWLQIIVLSPSLVFPAIRNQAAQQFADKLVHVMKIMKASNYCALLPPGSSEAVAGSDCQGFICACMCVSFVSRQAPEACQPRQDGSALLPGTLWGCSDLLAVHLSGCQGGDHGKEPQPLKGVFCLQHTQRCSRLFSEGLHGYQNHLVMLGQHFSSSGMLSFPGTKPKATDPAKHLTKELSKVISKRK